uniref:Kinesin light chain n=1 Tax=Pseudo-nitzschia australis TaxID=44445 RepID=A0A7S4AB04_9STRA
MNQNQHYQSGGGSLHSNSTKHISNRSQQKQLDSIHKMPSDYGYSMELPPAQQTSTQNTNTNVDAAIASSYNDGNGFTPFAGSSTRGSSVLYSTAANSNSNTPPRGSSYRDSANGGQAAGRSCLVIPSFGSGKKKKKPSKNNKSPKKSSSGGLFGRSPSSSGSGSTSAESSTADPFHDHNHNDKLSLLKSFSNKNGETNAQDWYLETMDEEDEYNEITSNTNNNDNSNRKSNHRPLQYEAQQQQQQPTTQQPYPHFAQPPRQNYNDENNSASSADAIPNLLKLPKADDRSHQARARQNKMHAYQGEMEPEGIRGQEATIVTGSTASNSRSGQSSPYGRVQPSLSSSSPTSTNQPTVAIRDFASSNMSESSSQLLPIRQVVSNREKPIRNSLLVSPKEEENEDGIEYDDPPLDFLADSSPLKAPPRYRGDRMTLASAASTTNFLSQDRYCNEEDDYSEDMISQNRDEIERQNGQEHDSRSSTSTPARSMILDKEREKERQVRAMFALSDNEQVKTNPNNNTERVTPAAPDVSPGYMARMNDRSEEQQFVGTMSLASTPSRSSRRSAPVNVDDASFEDPLDHIQGINAMAMEHVTNGEFDMALQAFTQVLKVFIQEHGQAHPLTASAHHNLGTVHTKRAGLLPEHTLHQCHCREQALKCFQAAARSARDCPSLGPSHPNVAVSLVRIGFLLLQSRQYRNAVITFEEALRIRTENYGPTHGLVANLYNNLGVCHMHLQNFREGRMFLQQALDIQKELLGQADDDDSTALLELADTLCNIGGLNLEWIRRQGPDASRALDAESAFLEALELRSKVLGEDHVLTNQVLSLHDMVRSIPLPNSDESPKKNINDSPSWSSPHSSIPGKMTSYGCHYSPAGISDMTSEVVTPVKHLTMQSDHERSILSSSTKSPEASADTSGLSIPALKVPTKESFLPNRRSRSPLHRNGVSNFTDGYDAMEESCLLRKPIDEEQSASQAGGFVSYAQSTISAGSGMESSKPNEKDRMATMKHAQAMLNSHRQFMNSPNRNIKANISDIERTIDERDGNANEDGLVPLAGNWLGPKNISRLSPGCLQNPTENLHTVHNCAVAYLAKGRHSEAVTLLEMVVECQKTRNGELHPDVGSAVHNVGIAYLRMEEHYDAFQAFEEAVRVRKASLGREHPEVAVSLVKFGISLMLLQRHEDALWIFRDALSIRKQALGDLHPSNARICNNIGCVHVELGSLKEARKEFEAALDIQRNALARNSENGPMIFGASTTLQNLGYLYGKLEMYEKAAMVLRESLNLQERIMYPEHPTVLITLESLAEICLDAQRFTHALKYFNQLFERSQSMQSVDCLKQATTLHTISTIYGHLDSPKEQKKKLEMALKFIRYDNAKTLDDKIDERLAFAKKIQGELEMLKETRRSKDNWA